jgi:hypothetical protein
MSYTLHSTQIIEGLLKQKLNFPFELVIGEDRSKNKIKQIVHQERYPLYEFLILTIMIVYIIDVKFTKKWRRINNCLFQ